MKHGALVTRLYPVARWCQEVIRINPIYTWLYFRVSCATFILCNLKIHRFARRGGKRKLNISNICTLSVFRLFLFQLKSPDMLENQFDKHQNGWNGLGVFSLSS